MTVKKPESFRELTANEIEYDGGFWNDWNDLEKGLFVSGLCLAAIGLGTGAYFGIKKLCNRGPRLASMGTKVRLGGNVDIAHPPNIPCEKGCEWLRVFTEGPEPKVCGWEVGVSDLSDN